MDSLHRPPRMALRSAVAVWFSSSNPDSARSTSAVWLRKSQRVFFDVTSTYLYPTSLNACKTSRTNSSLLTGITCSPLLFLELSLSSSSSSPSLAFPFPLRSPSSGTHPASIASSSYIHSPSNSARRILPANDAPPPIPVVPFPFIVLPRPCAAVVFARFACTSPEPA